jgi:hypothetical protein
MDDDQIFKSLYDKLSIIETRVLSSKALNGGFDKLAEQVDTVASDVRSIKKALYEPDSGLFSRVREMEAESHRRHEYIVETRPLLEEHKELQIWKQNLDKDLEGYDDLRSEVRELRTWKNGASKFIWALVLTSAAAWVKMFMDMVIAR